MNPSASARTADAAWKTPIHVASGAHVLKQGLTFVAATAGGGGRGCPGGTTITSGSGGSVGGVGVALATFVFVQLSVDAEQLPAPAAGSGMSSWWAPERARGSSGTNEACASSRRAHWPRILRDKHWTVSRCARCARSRGSVKQWKADCSATAARGGTVHHGPVTRLAAAGRG